MEPVTTPQLDLDPPPTTESRTRLLPTTADLRARMALPSLPEAHRSIPISSGASWFRKVLAFAGPGYLVAVGYMDPGNWATDLGGGSQFGYILLNAVLVSSLMAIFLQALSAKLGIATGRDLAQACREHYSRRTGIALWVLCLRNLFRPAAVDRSGARVSPCRGDPAEPRDAVPRHRHPRRHGDAAQFVSSFQPGANSRVPGK